LVPRKELAKVTDRTLYDQFLAQRQELRNIQREKDEESRSRAVELLEPCSELETYMNDLKTGNVKSLTRVGGGGAKGAIALQIEALSGTSKRNRAQEKADAAQQAAVLDDPFHEEEVEAIMAQVVHC